MDDGAGVGAGPLGVGAGPLEVTSESRAHLAAVAVEMQDLPAGQLYTNFGNALIPPGHE